MGLTPPGYVRIPFVGGPACGNEVLLKVTGVQQEYRVPVPTGRPAIITDPQSADWSGLEEAVYRIHRGPTGKAQYLYEHLKGL